jgi:hypothetical protein
MVVTWSEAGQLSSGAQVSILTCDPGEEVYSMYGHTAIRVSDPMQGIDVVFNYGVFSFDSPNFLYRFAKGQTDYMIVSQRFSSFLPEYIEDQRSVYEQVLNLSAEGKDQLFQALRTNALPENRLYRYNFFMDNCATRVRDMIEQNSGGNVSFDQSQTGRSYRQLIDEYHHSFRWIDLGIDLVIGEKAEKQVSAYAQMFLPEYLKDQLGKAQITLDGKTQALVLETRTLLEYPNSKQHAALPLPTILFGVLFLLVTFFSVRAYLNKRTLSSLDVWLFALAGFSGLIIGWVSLFSEHPAVRPNFNLFWAFPPHLLFAFLWMKKKWRPVTKYYFWVAGLLLIVSIFSGQIFNRAAYLIIFTLLVRVVANLMPRENA